jgi:hypothetical protein
MQEIVAFNILCAIIAAKWALELGLTQIRQALFGAAALVLGPFILLALYVQFLYKAKGAGQPSARWA